MKRCLTILAVLMMLLTLFACAKQSSTYTITKDNTEFRVDLEKNTISDETNTYQYEYSGNSSSYRIVIIYPNGSSYWYNKSGSAGNGGWSDDYDEDAYVNGDTLRDVVLAKAPKEVSPGKILGALVLAALGVVDIACPKVTWYLGYGWRFKDAEPSEAALIFARIGGAVAIVLGVILLLS